LLPEKSSMKLALWGGEGSSNVASEGADAIRAAASSSKVPVGSLGRGCGASDARFVGTFAGVGARLNGTS
jgi:hypothetical protein